MFASDAIYNIAALAGHIVFAYVRLFGVGACDPPTFIQFRAVGAIF